MLVNVSRGPLVDEPALVDALQSGRIAAPRSTSSMTSRFRRSSPFWTLPNVLDHAAHVGLAARSLGRGHRALPDNLRRFEDGRSLLNVVDKNAGY